MATYSVREFLDAWMGSDKVSVPKPELNPSDLQTSWMPLVQVHFKCMNKQILYLPSLVLGHLLC
jgi:hypothetical protein